MKNSLSLEMSMKILKDPTGILLLKPDMKNLTMLNPMEIPNGLTLDEVKNPHQIEKINSITFLNKYCEAAEKHKAQLIAQGKRSDYDELNKLWADSFKRSQVIYNIVRS